MATGNEEKKEEEKSGDIKLEVKYEDAKSEYIPLIPPKPTDGAEMPNVEKPKENKNV